jgi:hypothetical protein
MFFDLKFLGKLSQSFVASSVVVDEHGWCKRGWIQALQYRFVDFNYHHILQVMLTMRFGLCSRCSWQFDMSADTDMQGSNRHFSQNASPTHRDEMIDPDYVDPPLRCPVAGFDHLTKLLQLAREPTCLFNIVRFLY